MPIRVVKNNENPIRTISQDVLDYYFPASNWEILVICGVLKPGAPSELVDAASCTRCGCLALQSQWVNHINWHMNAVH